MNYQCYFLLLLLLLTSCSKNEIINEKDKKVTLSVSSVYVKSSNPDTSQPDSNAKVFIFFDHIIDDFVDCVIHEDGTVTKKDGLVMTADMKGATNNKGNIIFEIDKKDSYYVVFVFSNKLYGRTHCLFHRNSEISANMTFRFID